MPTAQNASLGSDIVFSCGTNDSSLDIRWFVSSNIATSILNEQLIEGESVSKVYWYIDKMMCGTLLH